jgi:P-type E1-E2 ATPase
MIIDNEINARPAHVLSRDGDEAEFKYTTWSHVKVGDVIRVKKGEVLPADLIFLSSASEVGICYIETSNLDGETDLKIRTCLAGSYLYSAM